MVSVDYKFNFVMNLTVVDKCCIPASTSLTGGFDISEV